MAEEKTNSRVGRQRRLIRVMNMVGNVPRIDPTANRNEEFVPCGQKNLFREFLRSLADNSPPLATAVRTLGLYVAGKRLVFKDKDGQEVQRAADVWNSLHVEDGEAHFRKATASDIALLGDRAWEVITTTGGQIAQLYHMDAMRVRLGKRDENGRIKKMFFSSNWELRMRGNRDYKEVEIPAFGSEGMRAAKKGILFAKDYHQGQDYYGLPCYLSALTDAEVFARIAVFNRTQIDTGFRPAFHIHAITGKDAENVDELDEMIEEIFTGPDGKSYALTNGTRDEAPIITKLERGDHAGELDTMGDRAEQVVYKACGIPPILLGVDVNTGMSGKGLALDQSVAQFMRTRIQPMQYLITDDALRIVQMMGVMEAVSCEVEQLIPFDPATDPALTRQTYLRRTLVYEDRQAAGLPPITTDGKEPKEDRSNWDPRNFLTLLEVGNNAAGLNEPTGEPTNTSDNA